MSMDPRPWAALGTGQALHVFADVKDSASGETSWVPSARKRLALRNPHSLQ